jgi:hypothetical protein
MSPRKPLPKSTVEKAAALKEGPSMDRERHLEDARHHPIDHPLPHPPHKPIKKPVLSEKHTTHTHLHEDDLGYHTNKPSPIRPAPKRTRTGKK